jgi:L-asparaginase/Glu-tRNA(Gln) amidotransferase subunit D
VGSTCSGLLSNERICRAVHVHKYRTKEVTDFAGLDCFTVSIIANRTAKVKNPRIKTPASRASEELLTNFQIDVLGNRDFV